MTEIITTAKFWGCLVCAFEPTAIVGSSTWLSAFAIVFQLCPEATKPSGASQMTQHGWWDGEMGKRNRGNKGSTGASIAHAASRHSGSMVSVMRVLQPSGDQTLCLFHRSRCHRRDSPDRKAAQANLYLLCHNTDAEGRVWCSAVLNYGAIAWVLLAGLWKVTGWKGGQWFYPVVLESLGETYSSLTRLCGWRWEMDRSPDWKSQELKKKKKKWCRIY